MRRKDKSRVALCSTLTVFIAMLAVPVVSQADTINAFLIGVSGSGPNYVWTYDIRLASGSKLDEAPPNLPGQGVAIVDIFGMQSGSSTFSNPLLFSKQEVTTADGDPAGPGLPDSVSLLNIELSYIGGAPIPLIQTGTSVSLGTLTFISSTNLGSDQLKVSSFDYNATGAGTAGRQFTASSAFLPDPNGTPAPVPLPAAALAAIPLFGMIGGIRARKYLPRSA